MFLQLPIQTAVNLVVEAFQDMSGGEIYVKKIPSMKVVDIAKAINPNAKLKYIGIRPGEKIHEQMIGVEDAPNTYEFAEHYIIFPQINNKRLKKGKLVSNDFDYTSLNNKDWMNEKDLTEWIKSFKETL